MGHVFQLTAVASGNDKHNNQQRQNEYMSLKMWITTVKAELLRPYINYINYFILAIQPQTVLFILSMNI